MATRLINIVPFTGLLVGTPTVLPHLLNISGRAVVPDEANLSEGGFTLAADDTNVTVTRQTINDPAVVSVLVESWYSPQRAFGTTPPPGTSPDGSLTPQPFSSRLLGTGGATLWQLDVPAIDTTGPVLDVAINQLRRADTSGGSFVMNLPTITVDNAGNVIVIKKLTGNVNTLTLDPAGAQTIDGIATLVLTIANEAAIIVSDGVGNWIVATVPIA